MTKGALAATLAAGLVLASATASALPALQLGPQLDGSGNPVAGWSYAADSQTWVYGGGGAFTLNAYANSNTVGANGDYAWEAAGADTRYAYLVVAAVPDLGDIGDILDLSVSQGTLVASGYGTPPVTDPNSLAPHGIFATYFELYEFQFDGPVGTITDTQPGQVGSGDGYTESFQISLGAGTHPDVAGVHMDLFTLVGDGKLDGVNDLVEAFAPFSHDAATINVPEAPEPGTLGVVGLGMLAFGFSARRRRT